MDDDLAKAKRQIAASQFRSLTTASGRAADLASNWHEARDLDFTRRYLAAIQAVTAADIRRAAATLTDERLSLTILDPLEAAGSGPHRQGRPRPARTSRSTRCRTDFSSRSSRTTGCRSSTSRPPSAADCLPRRRKPTGSTNF